jgi:hypothetical protein
MLLKQYTRIWPPKLGDNDLAIFAYRQKQLEHKFGKDKPIITHSPFPDFTITDKIKYKPVTNRNVMHERGWENKTKALAYLRMIRTKNNKTNR